MSEAERDLEYVMEKYGTAVRGVIGACLKRREEIDDLFQETFLLYYTKDLHFPEEGARRAWLIRTAVNLCRSANRSPWAVLRSGEEFDPDSVPYAESAPANGFADKTEIWEAVMRLKERYRLPLYLHYFEQMPISEVAAVLKISEGAVKMRLSRAREKLRQEPEVARYGQKKHVQDTAGL